MTTVSTVMARARLRLNEQDSTTFHGDEDFVLYADEAQKYVAKTSECLQQKSTTLTVADQADYAVPDDFIVMKRLLVEGKRARPINFEQIDDEGLEESNITSSGKYFYYIFADELTIVPTPSAVDLPIKLYYVRIPATLTLLTSSLEIPEYLEDSLVAYMTYCAWLKDIEYELADYNLAECNAKIALNKRQVYERDADSQSAIKFGQSTDRRRPLEGV